MAEIPELPTHQGTMLGIKIEGDRVPFDVFLKTLTAFRKFVEAMHSDIGVLKNLTWHMAGLALGSAFAAIEPDEQDEASVAEATRVETIMAERIALVATRGLSALGAKHEVTDAYIQMATAQGQRPGALKLIIGGREEPILQDWIWHASSTLERVVDDAVAPRRTYGTVRGLVETVSIHGRRSFMLYDDLHNRAIDCVLSSDKRDMDLGALLGRRAVVRGFLTPAGKNRAALMDDIESVTPIAPEVGNLADSRGELKSSLNEEELLAALRRVRAGE